MRKGLSTLFLLLATINVLWAQRDRGQLELGATYTRFTIEELSTYSVNAEFVKTFTGPIVLGFGGSYARAERLDTLSVDQELISFAIALHVYYALFKDDRQQLLAGGGLSGRFFNDQWLLDPELLVQKSAFKPGLALAAQYNFNLSDQWSIGGRATLQVYENENRVFLLGGHIGYSF
ncbi:MAG: hypothetical protein AAFP19_21710 [Bacteroidota bacterium]